MTEHENADAAMDHLTRTTPAMDLTVAQELLREAKEVFDGLGVVFFLRQGTCLGAIRDDAFIPWDDDIDIGSIVGMHGFNEDCIEPVADAFRARGFHVRRDQVEGEIWLGIMKNNIRIDWLCLRARQGHILHFPGVRLPIRLFEELKEIDFIGTHFLVPDPPEEYLAIKYGPNWMTPKRLDYGGDVIRNMPDGPTPGHPGRLKQRLLAWLPGQSARLRVLDRDGAPIPGAKITIAGLPDAVGRAAQIFEIIAHADINIDMIVQNISHGTAMPATDISFTADKPDLAKAQRVIDELQAEVKFAKVIADEDIAKVSVVGVGMRTHSGVAAKVFETLGEHGINIDMAYSATLAERRGLITTDELSQSRRLKNPIDRDAQIKRAMGFQPEHFTRINDLLLSHKKCE